MRSQQLERIVELDRLLFIIENLNPRVIDKVHVYSKSASQLAGVKIGSIFYKIKHENVFFEKPDRDALPEIVFKLKSLNIDFLIFDNKKHLIERTSE